jgi:hypothetical protein
MPVAEQGNFNTSRNEGFTAAAAAAVARGYYSVGEVDTDERAIT